MKPSYYNYYIPLGIKDKMLLYNSLTNSYIIISSSLYNLFINNINSIDTIKNGNEEFYAKLVDNNFIIKDGIDEKQDYLNSVIESRNSTNYYQLIINPTLACNLNCWYCYENHLGNSTMSSMTVSNILKHIIRKVEQDKFKELSLDFFGGEPFLRFNIVKEILIQVKAISEKYGFKLWVHFTTNATLINKDAFNFLKDYSPSFQITLDGNRERHNTVRIPINKKPTYDRIVKNIQFLTHQNEIKYILVRINFSAQTIEGLSEILDDFENCNKSKMEFRLFKVWQENSDSIDMNKLLKFIQLAQTRHFKVEYLPLHYNTYACYADRVNEAVINYDGNVYKCTGRDFTKEKAEGILMEDGTIQWNEKKINQRMNIHIQQICLNCKLLPSCSKICTQNLMERGDHIGCILEKGFSVEDYIIHNLNNEILNTNHE